MVLLEIYWVFFKISFISVGGVFGVLPELERMVVVDHQWISHEAFIRSYVIAQFVPGPNMAMCPLIGYWVAGWPGWVAGFLGIYTLPLALMGGTYSLYMRHRENEIFKRAELALRPIILGALFGSATYLWLQQTKSHWGIGIVLTVLGVWTYVKKWLDPFLLLVLVGVAWWILVEVLPSFLA